MTAYYNENDPKAVAWLRELIADGQIAHGEVDSRSIEDVTPNDLNGFTQCHFFAGIGGWSYALRLAGWPDDRPVWTGSCPCQPFSAAGKGAGFADERHLWPAWHWLIKQRRPRRIFGEQVATALQWWDLVSSDLEGEGYTTGATIIGAHSVGAPHIRQRLYWVGIADSDGRKSWRLTPASTRQGRPALAAGGPRRVADADGGLTSAEREQRSREYRQQSEDGFAREFCKYCGAGLGEFRRLGEGTCPKCDPAGCLEHAARNGREQRGTESGQRSALSGCSTSDVADTDCVQPEQPAGQRTGSGGAQGSGPCGEPSGSGSTGSMADTSSVRCVGGDGPGEDAGEACGSEGGVRSQRLRDEPVAGSGGAGDVAHASGEQSHGSGDPGRRRGEPADDCRDDCQLADTDEPGSQGRGERWNRADLQSAWTYSLVDCRDGKRRPVEPGTFPLAHGIPGRVGLLRGYGNAIVPQAAVAWIEACGR